MSLKTVSENDAWLIINSKKKLPIKSYINITSLKVDTTLITLGCVIETSVNPFQRWQHYQYAKKIKKSFDEIAKDFKIYIENFKQVYGFAAYKTTLLDSSMIAIKASVGNYPTVEDIYKKIKILEKYAAENNAIATNFPMLNVLKIDSNVYSFMVALPINKLLKNNGDILYKQMLAKGNFITTDSIYGGFKKTEKLFRTFITMKEDYQLMSPAIPFQSLVTDRRKESDSTKWITKFYYPIF